MSVLLIEDEPRIAAFLVKGLRARGYHVEHARTGMDGVRHVLDERACALEALLGMKRAGADAILTYFALDAARWLR